MAAESHGYKLLITYDVIAETAQSYYRFMLGRYVPLVAELGLEMSDAWHTAYGNAPNRLIGFVARDREVVRNAMQSDVWKTLNSELERYVTDLSYKVVPYREGFQY